MLFWNASSYMNSGNVWLLPPGPPLVITQIKPNTDICINQFGYCLVGQKGRKVTPQIETP